MFPKPTFSIDVGSLSEADLKRLQKLGEGACRTVYAYEDDLVLKVDRNRHRRSHRDGAEYFYNKNEWQFWEAIKDTPVARFFFPVVDYSPSTHFLLMERAAKVPDNYANTDKLPNYELFRKIIDAMRVSDMGPRNMGIRRDGTLAALDYGFQSKPKAEHIERAIKILEKAHA